MKKSKKSKTAIKSPREVEQEVNITMDEITAERKAKVTNGVSEAEVKAAVEQLNPDEASMESRG